MKTISSFLLPSLPLLALAIPIAAHATEEHKLTASDGGAGDFLGRSVGIHDEDIIAGAPGHSALGATSGAAYIWSHDGSDFVEAAKLLASDGAAGDSFGRAVAMGHHTAIVGAPGVDVGAADAGAAYVFVLTGSVWSQEAKLVPSSPLVSGYFGSAVSIEEDTVLIGSRGASAAYVFTRTGTVWSEEAVLTASDATVGNNYGISVSLIDDQALIGANRQDGMGAAYIYSRSLGVWTEDQKLIAGDRNLADSFGEAVAWGHSNMVVVGAPNDDGVSTNAGATYRFIRQGSTWTQAAKRDGLTEGDGMGNAVAVSYNFEVSGARFFDYQGTNSTGGTILWAPGNPLLLQIFVPSDPVAGGLLGNSVAMDLCNIVSGAVGDDELGIDAGAVYIFATVEGATTLVNGSGTNPVLMTTEVAPNIGADWHIELDMTAYPTADRSVVLVHRSFLGTPINMPLGELLLNLGTQRVFIGVELGSGIVSHEFAIPNDPLIVGIQVAAQAVLHDSVGGNFLTLTNGEQAVIGCHGGAHEE